MDGANLGNWRHQPVGAPARILPTARFCTPPLKWAFLPWRRYPLRPRLAGVFEGPLWRRWQSLASLRALRWAFAVIHHIAHLVYSGIIGVYSFSRDEIV